MMPDLLRNQGRLFRFAKNFTLYSDKESGVGMLIFHVEIPLKKHSSDVPAEGVYFSFSGKIKIGVKNAGY